MKSPSPIRAVVFDLLTGLLNSWTVWNAVAGDDALGIHWRAAYLRRTYAQQRYAPYLEIVAAAALDVGLLATMADALAAQWDSLAPWPEVPAVLSALGERTPLGVVTNCSQALGERAALAVGSPFDVVGAAAAGMPVYWHNRIGMLCPSRVTMPSPDRYTEARDLWGLTR